MISDRWSARLVGVFYIVASVAGVLSVAFLGPAMDASDDLGRAAQSDGGVTVGALLVLIMAFAVSGIAIAAYPVLRKHNPTIAIGYFGARIVEGMLHLAVVIGLLSVVSLSKEYVAGGSADDSVFPGLAQTLLAGIEWTSEIMVALVFSAGAVMFYILLCRAGLLPRWLARWGVFAALLWLVTGVLMLFSVVEPQSSVQIVLAVPIGVQEMVLAVWLIAKGFSATEAVPATRGAEAVTAAVPGGGRV